MKQLRIELGELIDSINMNWVNEIKRARDSDDGLDLLRVIPVISESINKKLEKLLNEFEVRNSNVKQKKSFF